LTAYPLNSTYCSVWLTVSGIVMGVGPLISAPVTFTSRRMTLPSFAVTWRYSVLPAGAPLEFSTNVTSYVPG